MSNYASKRLTLNDIAQLSGVSKTTASIILNGKGDHYRIKPETCEKVLEIAKQYNYRANAHAKALQSQRSNVIGLVVPDLMNYGFACTAKSLERLCRENGLDLIIACSDDHPQQEKQAIERLLDRQIDVLVTAPTHQDPDYYQAILQHTPVIHIDRQLPDLNQCAVTSNDTPYIAQLVAKIAQTYQPKEFCYFGGQYFLSPSETRLEGFKQGLAQAQMAIKEEWIFHRTYQVDSGYQMLSDVVKQLGRLPEAIFTASFTLLEGVLRYLTEHQLTKQLVEHKLNIITFDDHYLLNALPFHLHSIRQNHEQIAHEVFKLIQKKREGIKTEKVKVDCEIICRQ